MAKLPDVSMAELAGQMTINLRLTGVNVFRVRLWLGARLMRLGAWVMGCGIKFDQPHVTGEFGGINAILSVWDTGADDQVQQSNDQH